MSIGSFYRFQRATLAVREGGERRLLHMIPVDAVVCLASFSMGGRFVCVDCEGIGLMLFREDFVARTTFVGAGEMSEDFSAACPAIPRIN